jgi:hypothetical protein
VRDLNFSICSGGKFFWPGDSAFLKNGQKKCPIFDSPKKSWKKNEFFASTCVGTVFWHFFQKSGISPTLCRVLRGIICLNLLKNCLKYFHLYFIMGKNFFLIIFIRKIITIYKNKIVCLKFA